MNKFTFSENELEALKLLVDKRLSTINNETENDGHLEIDINIQIRSHQITLSLGLILKLNDELIIDEYDVLILDRNSDIVECENFNDIDDYLENRC